MVASTTTAILIGHHQAFVFVRLHLTHELVYVLVRVEKVLVADDKRFDERVRVDVRVVGVEAHEHGKRLLQLVEVHEFVQVVQEVFFLVLENKFIYSGFVDEFISCLKTLFFNIRR